MSVKNQFCKLYESEKTQILVRLEQSTKELKNVVIEFENRAVKVKTTFGQVENEKAKKFLKELTEKQVLDFLKDYEKTF